MDNKLKTICENLGWNITELCDEEIILQQCSPLGEDFSFTVSGKDFAREVARYADDFDAEEHAEMWIENRDKGVPGRLIDIIQDAYDIQKMLDELADALNNKEK